MIIKRLAEGIKSQNWFVVIVEVMIVVVGIFIGLQVDDWNEGRKLRASENIYLTQLIIDVESMQLELEKSIALAEGREEAMLRTLGALETCSLEEVQKTDFQRTFTEYQVILSIQVLDGTYKEMVSSGALASLSEPILRRSIQEMFTQLQNFTFAINSMRGTLPTVDAIVWQRVLLSYDENGQVILKEFNFENYCSDSSLRNAIVEMIDGQQDWKKQVNKTTSRYLDILKQLKIAIIEE